MVCNRVRVMHTPLPLRPAQVEARQRVGWRIEQPMKVWTEQSFFAQHSMTMDDVLGLPVVTGLPGVDGRESKIVITEDENQPLRMTRVP